MMHGQTKIKKTEVFVGKLVGVTKIDIMMMMVMMMEMMMMMMMTTMTTKKKHSVK